MNIWVTLALIFVYLTVYFKTDADGCLSVVIYDSGHVSAPHFTSTLHHLCLSPVSCLFLMFFLCENSSPSSFFALVALTHAGILGDFFFSADLVCALITWGWLYKSTCHRPYLISAFKKKKKNCLKCILSWPLREQQFAIDFLNTVYFLGWLHIIPEWKKKHECVHNRMCRF